MIHQVPSLLQWPDIHHGFFEQSAPHMPSLNCAFVEAEPYDQVHHQRQWMMEKMTGRPLPLLTLKQTHSTTVHIVESADQKLPPGDALVTGQKDIALGILAADCAPVLFLDPKARIIGAAHAGWRGAIDGILECTIDAMESLGAHRHSLQVALGPTIQKSHYEVGPEFESLLGKDALLFLNKAEREHHFYFDLPRYVLSKLEKIGVASATNLALNTFTNNFFSRRRALHKNQHEELKGFCHLSAIAIS